jgi:hypothetical protein
MAYLYRHIRLDKNEPFYIGIGSDEEGQYDRAYSKDSRTKYWRRIISKVGYEVEIVLDDLSWEEACEKEKEFIKLYGRKDLNEGTLVNMTDGGEGTPGFKHSDTTKEKCRLAAKNQKTNIKGTDEYEAIKLKKSEWSKGDKNPCFGKFGKDHPAFGHNGYWTGRENISRMCKVEYNGQVYKSKTELAKSIGVSNSLITKMVKRKEVNEIK